MEKNIDKKGYLKFMINDNDNKLVDRYNIKRIIKKACNILNIDINIFNYEQCLDILNKYVEIVPKIYLDLKEGLNDTNFDIKGNYDFDNGIQEVFYDILLNKYFSSLKTLPTPFPVQYFGIKFLTSNCNNFYKVFPVDKERKNIIFMFLFYNDFEMIKRTIKKLTYDTYHHFLIVFPSDVDINLQKEIIEYYKGNETVSIVNCGYISYYSSKDMEIIYSINRWIIQMPNWDFFIPLSQADYTLYPGIEVNNRIGNKTWCQENYDKYDKEDMKLIKYRFYDETRYSCSQYPRSSILLNDGRFPWFFDLIKTEFKIGWLQPHSSGGIFNRETIEFLVNNDEARAIYMFIRGHPVAGVEHYWSSIFTFPYFKDKLNKKSSVLMSWEHGRKGQAPGVSNTYLTINEYEMIKKAYDDGTLFCRKFNSKIEKDILDKIDELYKS